MIDRPNASIRPRPERATKRLAKDGFEVVVWIDPALRVGRSAAGTSHEVTVAGRPMVLDLPLRGPDEFRDGHAKNEWRAIPDFAGPPLAEPILRGGWISITSRGRPGGNPLILEAIRLRWIDPARRRRVRANIDAAFDFDKELAPWLAIAHDWLAAWRSTTRRYVAAETTPQMRMAVGGHDGAVGGGESQTFGLYFGSRPASRPRELRAAFAAASSGCELPLERQLYAEALAYAEAALWRQAIISACSAAEVALDSESRRLLERSGYSEKDCVEILKRTSGVMELYRIAATRRRGLPVSSQRVSDQLANPRNGAVHAGHTSDEATARRAIETAKKLVDLVPLQTPESFTRGSV